MSQDIYSMKLDFTFDNGRSAGLEWAARKLRDIASEAFINKNDALAIVLRQSADDIEGLAKEVQAKADALAKEVASIEKTEDEKLKRKTKRDTCFAGPSSSVVLPSQLYNVPKCSEHRCSRPKNHTGNHECACGAIFPGKKMRWR